jgi:hypothetical protein
MNHVTYADALDALQKHPDRCEQLLLKYANAIREPNGLLAIDIDGLLQRVASVVVSFASARGMPAIPTGLSPQQEREAGLALCLMMLSAVAIEDGLQWFVTAPDGPVN